jgi:HEAT repeat protein
MRKPVLSSHIEIISPAFYIKCWVAMALGVVLLFLSCGLPPKQQAQKILQDGINDESVIIRVNAAKGLKKIGDVQGTKILYEILRGEDKNGVVAVLAALYDLKESRYAPVILELSGKQDALTRAEAYRLISIMEDPKCKDILIKGTQDKIAKIRRFSYLGLEKFNAKQVIRDGLHDVDILVKIAAAKALGRLGEKDMENFVRRQMETVNLEIWKHGIIALAEMGDTSAIDFIKESLDDAPWELRLAAAEALLIFNSKEGVGVIREGLETGGPFVRVKVVQILSKYRIGEGQELLEKATQDEYINVSVVAIEALAKYRQKTSRGLFIELMNAPNPLVKIAAAAAFLQVE